MPSRAVFVTTTTTTTSTTNTPAPRNGRAANDTPIVFPPQCKGHRDPARDIAVVRAAPEGAVQQVYTPGYAALLEVPAAAVHHLPDPGLHVT
eukprot:CAMPEP_0174827662 /NCGR_PEP_ID=MMETSP1114-20130205/862_1 /TAXON_ID=312471 /ORGANISM="Neobodo designis, Strain CCAP 1951/1" /LENGTH=91 /DNA_ID=CAMNT_0016061333 /DNA_START=272 /DNA_END=544 /DNA_ORIENTATION=+